jgi:hypothetical protein
MIQKGRERFCGRDFKPHLLIAWLDSRPARAVACGLRLDLFERLLGVPLRA